MRLNILWLFLIIASLNCSASRVIDNFNRDWRYVLGDVAGAEHPDFNDSVPLFISAFRRANDLALAMEARCYHGGEGRTKMKPLKYKGVDGVAYLLIAAYFAAVILLRRFL